MVRIKQFTTAKTWKTNIVREHLHDRSNDSVTFRRNGFHLKKTKEHPEQPQKEPQLES